MAELAPELEFIEQVANPAIFADVSPDRALKVLAYRMPS
jgi:23S rRNA (cytosine1962-C5)-methyltransferase